jgi:methenyltetrahydromethanopterin cyclohydrolase
LTATLNERAWAVADDLAANAAEFRVAVHDVAGARVLDCGVQAVGGIAAGVGLARVCLAGLGDVTVVPGDVGGVPCPLVHVTTDHPVPACMASQYAGWQVSVGKFFAMGSGPMRAALGKEALFDHLPGREQSPVAVGVLETRKLPGEDVVRHLAERLNLAPDRLTLLAAPTSSMAGTIQVVARSVETTLHKLHELKFDLGQVVSGSGWAPMPPAAADDLEGIGRTNDAILYGGKVVLWVRGDDAALVEVGPKVPSRASADHGAPFAEVFKRYNGDFYKIDPLLFSPAEVVFCNLATGRTHTFGAPAPDVLRRSFFGVAG